MTRPKASAQQVARDLKTTVPVLIAVIRAEGGRIHGGPPFERAIRSGLIDRLTRKPTPKGTEILCRFREELNHAAH